MSPAFAGDFTEHRMPSGDLCFYKDTDHSYWERCGPKKKRDPDGEWGGSGRLTGVTTVAAPFSFDSSGPLMGWAVRINLEGVAALFRRDIEDVPPISWDDYLLWLADAGQIKERLRQASLTDEDARDFKGDIGTAVHLHVLNALAAGQPVPDYAELHEEERPHASAVEQFWLEHSPRAMQAEQVVCDLGLEVAGRLDFRGRIERCGKAKCACARLDYGAVAIIDLKTGKYIGASSHVQVGGYDHLSRVAGFGKSDAQFILHSHDDGTYSLIRSHASREDFLTAVEIYRRAAAINKAANRDRKERHADTAGAR